MKEKSIVRYTLGKLPEDHESDWERVKAMTEEEIDEAARSDPDAQPIDAEFWERATIISPEPKKSVHLRIDPDVLAWFKKQGKGYQTRMNAVLRSYMEARSTQGREDRPR